MTTVSVQIFKHCSSHVVLDNTFDTYFYSTIQVITVRNSVMHSPDLKVSNEDMKNHHKTLLLLAEKLRPHVPEMKDLEKKLTQVGGKLFILLLLIAIRLVALQYNCII